MFPNVVRSAVVWAGTLIPLLGAASSAIAVPPANDNFADATLIQLTGQYTEVPGTLMGAGVETGEPWHAGAPPTGSVWYRWLPTARGNVAGIWVHPNFSQRVAVYEGTDLATLTTPDVWPLPGHSYYIAVDRSLSSPEFDGSFTLLIRFDPVPPNDSFSDAQVIEGESGEVSGGVFELASLEPNEPQRPGCSGYPSIWYQWTAPRTGDVNMIGVRGQLGVFVYRGARIDQLEQVAAGIDSYCGYTGAAFHAEAGETYHISVHDCVDYPSGYFTLRWTYTGSTGPPNDNLATAASLEGERGTVHGTNLGATQEPDEPGAGFSVWYQWTAPTDGRVTFGTTNYRSYADRAYCPWTVWAFVGDSLESLDAVEAVVEAGHGRVLFNAVAGTQYKILFTARSQDDFDIRWHTAGAGSPVADLTGQYAGTFASDYPQGGTILGQFEQDSEGDLTGSVTLIGADCPYPPAFSGRVSGNGFTGAIVQDGTPFINIQASFTAHEIEGTYQVVAGCANGDTGTLTLTFVMPTPTDTPIPTFSTTPTYTSTATYTFTPTVTATATQTGTSTGTRTPTVTPTVTATATQTGTSTRTPTPTGTASPTPTRTPTETPTPIACVGDCDGSLSVTVDELVRGVNIALGNAGLQDCLAFDINDDDSVTVDELVAAVNRALNGCP